MSLASLIKKGSLRGVATATPATPATHGPYSPPTVATVAVANGPKQAANDSTPDIDRWCYPHSTAMNTAEIDTLTTRLTRLTRFTGNGLLVDDAEKLADKLVIRDRELDDRRLCLECAHLGRGWQCGNWRLSGVALKSRDATLPTDLVTMLQRCDGFAAH